MLHAVDLRFGLRDHARVTVAHADGDNAAEKVDAEICRSTSSPKGGTRRFESKNCLTRRCAETALRSLAVLRARNNR